MRAVRPKSLHPVCVGSYVASLPFLCKVGGNVGTPLGAADGLREEALGEACGEKGS